MRATKGLWAALGAGVSLAAAALIVLATMSVVLAVGGWPRGHTAPREGAVALQAARSARVASPAPGGGAAPRAHRAAAPRHGAVRLVSARRFTRRPSSSVPSAKVSVPGAPAAATTQSGGSRPGSGGGTALVTTPVTKATGTVGTTVTNVTSTAGQVLDPISQPVGDAVTAVGQQAGQTVDQVGQAVGGVVGGLTAGSK